MQKIQTEGATVRPVVASPTINKRLSIGKVVSTAFSLVFLAALASVLILSKKGFDERMEVIKASNNSCSTEYCIKVTMKYSKGALSWNAIQGVSLLGFTMSTNKSYADGEDVVLSCPTNFTDTKNELLFKISLMVDSASLQNCK